MKQLAHLAALLAVAAAMLPFLVVGFAAGLAWAGLLGGFHLLKDCLARLTGDSYAWKVVVKRPSHAQETR